MPAVSDLHGVRATRSLGECHRDHPTNLGFDQGRRAIRLREQAEIVDDAWIAPRDGER
jgi:hypothetical protein